LRALAIGTQSVRLVDPYAIDHLTAVLGDHVEQVVDDARVRRVGRDFLAIRRAHVHHDRFEPRTSRGSQQAKERSQILACAAATDPKHALPRRLDHHRGVAVALLDRELIEPENRDTAEIDRPEPRRQVALVDLLDRLPVEPDVRGHVAQAHHRTQPNHALGQPRRHARVPRQPRQQLELRSAVRACHPQPRYLELHRVLEQRQVADPPPRHVVKGSHRPQAAAADGRCAAPP
jgi:hypothetical protein